MLNKETVLVAIKLFIITAVSALFLAVVNMITVPIIAENSEKAATDALRMALPEADSFKKADFSVEDTPVGKTNNVKIEAINIGLAGEKGIGYVVTAVSSEGYGGDIRVLVGLDNSKNVTCVKILSSSETPGLGGNASKPEFINQYIGKTGSFEVVKNAPSNELEISAISGATKTSRAVTNCINAAIELVNSKIEKGFDSKATAAINEKLEETKRETELQMQADSVLSEEGGSK